MRINERIIQTKQYVVELTKGDVLGLKVAGNQLAMVYAIASNTLHFIPESNPIDRPVFSLSMRDWSAMCEGFNGTPEYVGLHIPAMFYGEVAKRLAGLPIPLPVVRKKNE